VIAMTGECVRFPSALLAERLRGGSSCGGWGTRVGELQSRAYCGFDLVPDGGVAEGGYPGFFLSFLDYSMPSPWWLTRPAAIGRMIQPPPPPYIVRQIHDDVRKSSATYSMSVVRISALCGNGCPLWPILMMLHMPAASTSPPSCSTAHSRDSCRP
jgi:hypothetical protein